MELRGRYRKPHRMASAPHRFHCYKVVVIRPSDSGSSDIEAKGRASMLRVHPLVRFLGGLRQEDLTNRLA